MYVISKYTRTPTPEGYAGPSCNKAGIEFGKKYKYFEDAVHDAEKLQEYNPVGWTVSCSENLSVIWNSFGGYVPNFDPILEGIAIDFD